MERNVGRTDQLARIAVGALAGLASIGVLAGSIPTSDVVALVLGVVALVLLATGLSGTCGAYSLLGVNTRGR